MRNVLLVDLGKQYGGAEKYIEHIEKNFEKEYVFHLLVRNACPFYNILMKNKIERVISINLTVKSLIKDLLYVGRYIKKNHIEIIHVNGVNSEVFTYLLKLYLKNEKIKYVSTVHGIAEKDRMEKNKFQQLLFAGMQIKVLRNFDRIIAVSYSIKEDLLKKGINEDKIQVIYHSIETEENQIRKKYERHRPLKVCSVGRLEKVKNTQMLIETIALLDNKEEFLCDIYGMGSLYHDLDQLIIRKGLENIIHLKGFENDVKTIYRKYDVMVQPSLYESFGMTVIEAMAAGLPVICSDVGGLAEIVKDKENGFLFNVDSTDELAKILLDINNDRYDLEKIRENAQIMIKERFQISTYKNKLRQIYEERT